MCYFSRLYQLVKLFLFAPSSGVCTCPLAMTDGAAKTIEVSLGSFFNSYQNLTGRLVGVYAVTLDPLLYGIIYVTWYTRLLAKATRVRFW